MRHDDSSRRPRVDPSQNPRLAAALGRLSQGIRDAIEETPSARAAAVSALAPSTNDVYVPDNDEVELLDDDGPDTMQRADASETIEPTPFPGPRSYEGEMIPAGGGLAPMPLPGEALDAANEAPPPPSLERAPVQSLRQGVIAYGGALPPEPPPDEEVLEPSDSELELVDAPVAGGAAHEAAADYPSAPPAGAPAYEGASDLDPTPLYDAPAAPSSDLSAEPPAEPPAEAPAEPPAAPTGDSPWATAAAAKPIDMRDLPSSHAPIAPDAALEKPKAAANPAAAEPAPAGRSWLTIFLAIALVASVVTFLLLKFNVIAGPEGRPSTDRTPIQVPTSTPASPNPPVTAAAPPETPTAIAAPEPSDTAAAPEPSVSAAPEPPDTAAPGAGAAPTTTPGGQAPGAGTAPTGGIKPGGASQPGKKPSRIF